MLPRVGQAIRSVSADLLPSADVTTAIAGGLAQSVTIGLVAAALLLIAPLALYFVFSDD
jgi:hypothetical protein